MPLVRHPDANGDPVLQAHEDSRFTHDVLGFFRRASGDPPIALV
jgi:hypothetical protein